MTVIVHCTQQVWHLRAAESDNARPSLCPKLVETGGDVVPLAHIAVETTFPQLLTPGGGHYGAIARPVRTSPKRIRSRAIQCPVFLDQTSNIAGFPQ
jgi:hypothetical protein